MEIVKKQEFGEVTLMKRAIFALLVISACSDPSLAKYSGGSGDAGNPYQIANIADLLTLANDVNDYDKCFLMTADINMQGQVFMTACIAPDTDSTPGSGFNGTPFTGAFDGDNHSIVNLTINVGPNSKCSLGLFGCIGQGGLVKNTGIEDVNIAGEYSSDFVGGLCGYNYYGSIINCYSTGSIAGNHYGAGGLCGYNRNGTITDSFSNAALNGGWNAGGLCGDIAYGNIINCYSTGNVSGDSAIGGLFGYSHDSNISDCFSTGQVTGTTETGGLFGAINYGSISNCYSTGDVIGINWTGGLCGVIFNGNVIDCYSTGQTSGVEATGGLCGQSDGNIISCYYYSQ